MNPIPGRRKRRLVHGALLGLWVLGSGGFRGHAGDPLSGDHRLLDVPFFADKTDQCGPAALASVLSFWGPPVNPAALKKEIYLAHLKGSLAMDLLIAAQDRGFSTRLYNGDIKDLKLQVARGRPVIAFIDRGVRFFPVGHYVVVTGFDEGRRGLYVHSGATANHFVRSASFLKEWNKTDRATLLIEKAGPEWESPHEPPKT